MTMKDIARRIAAESEGDNGNPSRGSRSSDNNEIYGKVRFSFITGGSFVVSLIASVFIMIAGSIVPMFFYIGIILFCISAVVLLFGALVVHEMEIVIIERWGAYWKRLKPGLNFTVPGLDKVLYKDPVAKTLPTAKIMVVPLLVKVDVDFEDSTEQVDFGANIQIEDAKLGAYSAHDLEAYIRNLIENPAKSAFGKRQVEKALEQREQIIKGILADLKTKAIGEYEDEDGLHDLTGEISLKRAGIKLVSLYLNDIVLGDDTLEERKKIFAIRQQTKVADKTVALEISNTRIEEQKVLKAEQLKLQTEKDYQGRRLGLEALAGIDQENPDNRMSITQAAQFDVDTKKYGRGVDRISEIKIEGGATDLTSMAAGLAAIAGKTAEESGDTGKKAAKSKDTED
ncbi:MAG: hypothetical protein KAI67_05875 [Candidatus Pacebacteria bacterium]|nr:hypothetical protein [Candidatus Paceibacterota bacterium]